MAESRKACRWWSPSPHASGLATPHAELQRPDGGAPSLRLRKMSHPIPAVDVRAATAGGYA